MARMMQTAYSAEEFDREARRIESLIWGATGIGEGESVLLCGMPNDEMVAQRIAELGAKLTVIDSRDRDITRAEAAQIRVMRGSTSVIPARDQSFDVTLAFHYLHEVDPFFHQQIVSELARVGRRLVVVELAAPADLLGRRIALLYSRAKRELGLFEYYQPLDYWKKLISMVKAEVAQSVYAFTKVPPEEYLEDTIDLLLDTMEIEEAPEEYLDELREIAEQPAAKLLPQARYVLVGAAPGELPKRKAAIFADLDTGTAFAAAAAAARPEPVPATGWVSEEPAEPESLVEADEIDAAPERIVPPYPEVPPPPALAPPPPPPPEPAYTYQEVDQDDGIPAPPSLVGFDASPQSGPEFGFRFDETMAPMEEPPGFGIPEIPPVTPGSGWQWEPPDGEESEGLK